MTSRSSRSRARKATQTEVHVILTGILSLIPRKEGKTDKGWRIRLQDAREHSDHGHHAGPAHEPHFPSLVAEQAARRGGPSWDRAKDGTQSIPALGAWLLHPGTLRMRKVSTASPRLPGDAALPFVLKVRDGSAGKRRGWAKKTFTGVDLDLDRGTLAATALEPARWKWDRQDAPGQDWTASEVCWHFAIDGDELTIDLPGQAKPLVLGPPANQQTIELRLQNVPELDLFPGKPSGKPTVDPHVALYFAQTLETPRPRTTLTAPEEITPEPPFAELHDHRLAATRLVPRMAKTLRINCPPAAWLGMA